MSDKECKEQAMESWKLVLKRLSEEREALEKFNNYVDEQVSNNLPKILENIEKNGKKKK